jgi:hypothetical protein
MPVTALVAPGPEVTSATPTFSVRARETVGGVHGGLLVAYQHVADRFLLEERVVDEEDRAARVAEDILDLFFLQAPDYNFGSGQHHRELALLGFG